MDKQCVQNGKSRRMFHWNSTDKYIQAWPVLLAKSHHLFGVLRYLPQLKLPSSCVCTSIHLPLSSAMQAALAVMAAHTVFSTSPFQPLLSALGNSYPPPQSSFHGVSLNLKLPPQSLTLAAADPSKPLTIVAATKKAVSVLKGNSAVEGVVTLTQEDNGLFSFSSFSSALFVAFSSSAGIESVRIDWMVY